MIRGEGHPLLVIVTLILLALLACIVLFFNRVSLPPAIEVRAEKMPTVGNKDALVHLIVFEEPKCSACKKYTEQIYPQIKKEYVDTGKISYTVIPISFLPDSLIAAASLLCVYHQDPDYPNPELFFTYLNYMYSHQSADETVDWATPETLIEFAQKASSGINIEKLKACMDDIERGEEVLHLTLYADEIMQGKLLTPTIYVNGMKVQKLTFSNLKNLIDAALKKEATKAAKI